MRVLFVNRADAEERWGGDTVQMQETARALVSLGVEVEIHLGARASYEGFDIIHLFNLQTPDFTHAEAVKAKAAGRKVVVSTIYWDFGAELLLYESRRWGQIARTVGQPAALALARRYVSYRAKEPRKKVTEILKLADMSLPNSKGEINHLRRLWSGLRSVRVVPNAIDPMRFDPAVSRPKPEWALDLDEYILIVARIEPHKNQLDFCRAIGSLGHSVVLAGPAVDAAYLSACQEAGAVYAGHLVGEELVAAYAHAKIHALPSFRETPGLASLEAAAMGCGIVSTDAGCAREYLGEDAEYCSPNSISSMRTATEAAWKAGAPEGLSDRIRTTFTWQKAAEATLAAYKEVLGAN